MLDDLRNTAADSFQEEELPTLEPEIRPRKPRKPRRKRQFLGLTSNQRFVVALLLLVMTCVLGSVCLVITQRVMF